MKNSSKIRSEKALKNLLEKCNKLTVKIINLQRENEQLKREKGARK